MENNLLSSDSSLNVHELISKYEGLQSEKAQLEQKYQELENQHRQLIQRHKKISARVAHIIGRLKVFQQGSSAE